MLPLLSTLLLGLSPSASTRHNFLRATVVRMCAEPESAAEKLARLEALELSRYQAERLSAPRKTIGEKLRIVFFGKPKIATASEGTLSTVPFVLPEEVTQHPEVSPPAGFAPPTPRPFLPTGDWLTLLSSTIALALRFVAGVFVTGWRPRLAFRPDGGYSLRLFPFLPLFLCETSHVLRGNVPRPQGRLLLYEFDSSPFCRKVRDACTQLDLTIECRPCPGAGVAIPNPICEEHLKLHGRRTVPFLLDEGAGIAMFESEDIIRYLYRTYGPGEDHIPFSLRGTVALASAGSAAIVRGMPADKMQVDARPDNHLMRPLTVYGYEGSPFCHPVREKLCALGLPHIVVPCGRGSANRAKLAERTGHPFQVPYLVDPNTGVEMSESIEIRMFLDRVYTTSGYTPLRGGSYLSDFS